MEKRYLKRTPLLNYDAPTIQRLIADRGWQAGSAYERIGSAYSFVKDEIRFGYNTKDALPASRVFADGYGQCNTKSTLLLALLRALGIECRLHGFTIHKSLQRGVVPELVYALSPDDILHTWVEVKHEERWLNLEGFILDAPMIRTLQAAFPGRSSLCAYGTGTDCLQKPETEWRGTDTYIQRTGINHDFGVFDAPDDFYALHEQLTGPRGWFYRLIVRHWMNARVKRMRQGWLPAIPNMDGTLEGRPDNAVVANSDI